MFCEILEYNSCLLAKAIQTKSCRQVYEYIKSDPVSNEALSKATRLGSSSRNAAGYDGGATTSGVSGVSNSSVDNRPGGLFGRKSKKQKARKTHFLAYKLHDAAAAIAEQEEQEENGEGNISETGTKKSRKRKQRSGSKRGIKKYDHF